MLSVSLAYTTAPCLFSCILPLDAASSVIDRNTQNAAQAVRDRETYLKYWETLYWGSMILNIFIFNAQKFYHMQGHLRVVSKIKATAIVITLAYFEAE